MKVQLRLYENLELNMENLPYEKTTKVDVTHQLRKTRLAKKFFFPDSLLFTI